MVILGAYMFVITADGHIIKICIACNSVFTNILGIVALVTGIAGLIGTIPSGKEALSGNLHANG